MLQAGDTVMFVADYSTLTIPTSPYVRVGETSKVFEVTWDNKGALVEINNGQDNGGKVRQYVPTSLMVSV
jgi:hypothetical protein